MTMARGTIESTNFGSLVEEPLPEHLGNIIYRMRVFNDLAELWGTELSRTIGLHKL